MINKNKKGGTLVYAMILVNIAIVIMYVVVNKSNFFYETINMQNYNIELNENLKEKAVNSLKYNMYLNNNGSGFIDTISCPKNISLSGTTINRIGTIPNTIPYYDSNLKKLFCSGSTLSGNLLLSYNSLFDGFSDAKFNGGTGLLYKSGLYYTGLLNDPSKCYISFTGSNILSGIDSNFNSDDYKVSSIGYIYYPNNIVDDDALSRLTRYGFVKIDKTFSNIFWNNQKINEYIRSNFNNYDNKNALIGDTSSGKLFIDVNFPYSLKIIEFDSGSFINKNELIRVNEWYGTGISGSGYISSNLNNSLYLSSLSSSGMILDFKNKNYGVFLAYNGTTEPLILPEYKIISKNENGSGVYINPINDSNPSNIRYLGSDIIIDKAKFISKIIEY